MLHTLRCKRAIWRVRSIPWRQRAVGKVRSIWVIAHANVWISHGLVPAARHTNLGLAHRGMLCCCLGWGGATASWQTPHVEVSVLEVATC